DFQKDMLQSLGNTIGKMKRLITRLRNFEEKQVLNRSLADLHWIVYDVVALVGAGEVKVQTRSVFSEVDAEEIQKVVLNLVLNAIEATGGKGPVTVEVGGDETAFIRVRDCGCGMTEEFMRMRLFKPFHTTKAKGLGIGLYQCKQIIEAHGGRIEVSSEAGRGSTFTVHLPAAKEADCTVQCNA
ncbi:MAG TPA: ATP-binding protein, partial [Dissulfurispiraceae bacterium]